MKKKITITYLTLFMKFGSILTCSKESMLWKAFICMLTWLSRDLIQVIYVESFSILHYSYFRGRRFHTYQVDTNVEIFVFFYHT